MCQTSLWALYASVSFYPHYNSASKGTAITLVLQERKLRDVEDLELKHKKFDYKWYALYCKPRTKQSSRHCTGNLHSFQSKSFNLTVGSVDLMTSVSYILKRFLYVCAIFQITSIYLNVVSYSLDLIKLSNNVDTEGWNPHEMSPYSITFEELSGLTLTCLHLIYL